MSVQSSATIVKTDDVKNEIGFINFYFLDTISKIKAFVIVLFNNRENFWDNYEKQYTAVYSDVVINKYRKSKAKKELLEHLRKNSIKVTPLTVEGLNKMILGKKIEETAQADPQKADAAQEMPSRTAPPSEIKTSRIIAFVSLCALAGTILYLYKKNSYLPCELNTQDLNESLSSSFDSTTDPTQMLPLNASQNITDVVGSFFHTIQSHNESLSYSLDPTQMCPKSIFQNVTDVVGSFFHATSQEVCLVEDLSVGGYTSEDVFNATDLLNFSNINNGRNFNSFNPIKLIEKGARCFNEWLYNKGGIC